MEQKGKPFFIQFSNILGLKILRRIIGKNFQKIIKNYYYFFPNWNKLQILSPSIFISFNAKNFPLLAFTTLWCRGVRKTSFSRVFNFNTLLLTCSLLAVGVFLISSEHWKTIFNYTPTQSTQSKRNLPETHSHRAVAIHPNPNQPTIHRYMQPVQVIQYFFPNNFIFLFFHISMWRAGIKGRKWGGMMLEKKTKKKKQKWRYLFWP